MVVQLADLEFIWEIGLCLAGLEFCDESDHQVFELLLLVQSLVGNAA